MHDDDDYYDDEHVIFQSGIKVQVGNGWTRGRKECSKNGKTDGIVVVDGENREDTCSEIRRRLCHGGCVSYTAPLCFAFVSLSFIFFLYL
uniref:Uncharacterized protein n=1 Tax=Cucumis melo TaxID=3656 RepID=A0A9I9EF30_CUCME